MNKRRYRHEYKFIIDAKKRALLYSRLRHLLPVDTHVGDDDSYWIRSVYFDDFKDSAFMQNEAGVNERTKYRIRIYNISDDIINLECKSKMNSMTNKESVRLSKEQTLDLIEGRMPAFQKGDAPLLSRFKTLMHTKLLRPKCIVEYERFPFVYRDGNVRITLDENISSSADVRGFFNKNNARYPILAKGQSLMEVKFDEFLPSFIKEELEMGSLMQTSFSKYYLCRKYSNVRIGNLS